MKETVLQKRRKYLRESFRQKALKKIDKIAQKLYSLGAHEVYVFGSVLKPELFDENSDVDMAVKGLSADKKYRALREVEEIFEDIPFDLIFLDEELRQEIRERIEKEGIVWKP